MYARHKSQKGYKVTSSELKVEGPDCDIGLHWRRYGMIFASGAFQTSAGVPSIL